MGIEKVGIKIFSPVVEKLVQKVGARSILQTKTPIFHGINPTLTYVPSGKTFALPRFCSEEMQVARKMNKIAIRKAKAGEVVRTYPKATPQDLKRLTSETIEDSYSRVEWTNPKDGKVYNLLKQGETDDGKVIVRILDEEGAFVKEAEITPKSILISDDFDANMRPALRCSLIDSDTLSHGNLVKRFIQAYNPFVKISVTDSFSWNDKVLEEIINKLKNGSKIDFINCSHGYALPKDTVQKFSELEGQINPQNNLSLLDNLIPKTNTRVIFSSCNGGAKNTSINLRYRNFEGCGALNSEGKIADFSSSRNSMYTQHYEQGQFKLIVDKDGLKIEGTPIIIPYEIECDKIGKKVEEVLSELVKKDDIFLHNWQGANPNFRMNSFAQYYDAKTGRELCVDNNGRLIPALDCDLEIFGTSFSTPIRTAKLALNDMMEGIL